MQDNAPTSNGERLRIPNAGLIAIATSVLAVVFFLVQPTFPSYDGYYSLLWAREIVGGSLPNFQLPAAPTEHPAGILLGIGSLAFGDEAERAYVLVVLLSFGALVAGIYSLGAELFNRTVGLVAGLIVLTRFDLVALAVRGFVDIPFLALIIWSAVLVAREPKRTQPAVFVLLTVAGLLRPEAWLFIGIYFLFCSRGMFWGQRVRYAAVVAIGPLVWFTIDWLVTGNPLFSLTATRELAGELGRSRGFFSVLFDLPVLIARTVKMSVLIAGVLGLGIGLHYWRERMYVPLATAAIGLGTFLLTAAVGLSINVRYLSIVSVIICLGAALALAAWTVPGGRGRLSIGVALLAAALLIVRLPSQTNSFKIEHAKMTYVRSQHDAMRALLVKGEAATLLAKGRCKTLTVPSHQNVPVARYLLRAERDQVVASTYQTTQPLDGLLMTANVELGKVPSGPGGTVNWWAVRSPPGFTQLARNGPWTLWAGACRTA